MIESKFTRREMLGIVGGGFVGSVIVGLGVSDLLQHDQQESMKVYAPESDKFDVSKVTHASEDESDLLLEPLFRASNVLFIDGEHVYAHGSIVNTGEQMVIHTSEHVAEVSQYAVNPHISISGIERISLETERFIVLPQTEYEWESQAFYTFDAITQEMLYKAQQQEQLQPIILATSLPQSGESVVIPNSSSGKYELFSCDRYYERDNLLELRGSSLGLCAGDSGSPVLQIDQGLSEIVPTGFSYGTLQGVTAAEYFDKGIPCSKTIFARPNN